MNKTCQNCKAEFRIEPDDFVFYKKINVPEPTLCPDCRQQRRLAIRNERVFYNRTCDSCKKQTIAYHPPDRKQVVYCPECWYSDKWNPFDYGRDFDFTRPFFDQFRELYQVVPTLSLDMINCKESQYVSYCGDDKRCYLDIAGEANQDCYYCKFVKFSVSCVDCSFVYNSELNYECVNCHRISGSTFLNRCLDSFNCHFCYDCRNCSDCFGCWNLRNKKYCIFNQQYSKEEYERRIAELGLGSHAALGRIRQEVQEKSKDAIHRFANTVQCEDSTGDDLRQCRNVKDSFDVTKSENSKWLADVLDAKECMDINFSLYEPQSSFELISTLQMTYSGFCFASHYSTDLWYCDKCNHSQSLFGCSGLTKQKYCILNKQYSKEDYVALKVKIIEHMKKISEWGEYFPVGTSGFGYNETIAQEYYPLTRDECLARGWPWRDTMPGSFGKETMKADQIPDHIKDVPDTISKEMLVCEKCGRNYRVIPQELRFLHKMNLPAPRQCTECRHLARNTVAGARHLWHRQCTCEIVPHPSHTQGRCKNEFETTYAPERAEKVYCESCYQSEVI